MLSRHRKRYDPEVFYAGSSESAGEEGKKLVDDMKAFRESIRGKSAEKSQKAHSQVAQSQKPQIREQLQCHQPPLQKPQKPPPHSVARPAPVKDAASPFKRSEPPKPQPGSSQIKPKEGVQPEDVDELIKHLHDLNLNISHLQMLMDRESELWDLHSDKAPSYLDALHRVIEAHGKPQAKLDDRSEEWPSKHEATFGNTGILKLPAWSKQQQPAMHNAPVVQEWPITELGGGCAWRRYHGKSAVVAGSSRWEHPKAGLSGPYHELKLSASRERLIELPELCGTLDAAFKRRAVALPPQPARWQPLPPVFRSAVGFNRAEADQEGVNGKEVDLSVRRDAIAKVAEGSAAIAVSKAPSDEAGFCVEHTSPDGRIHKQGKGQKKQVLVNLKEKLAHNLSVMAQSLRDVQKSGKRASGSTTMENEAVSDSPEGNARYPGSKREGKLPKRRQVQFAEDHLERQPLQNQDGKFKETLFEQIEQRQRQSLFEEKSPQRSVFSRQTEDAAAKVLAEMETMKPETDKVENRLQIHKEEEELLKDQKPNSLVTECICCGDEKPTLHDFPAHPPTYSCEHPVRTCKDCMETWLASELAGKGCKSLHCPECRKEMEYEDVRRGASMQTREEYDRRLFLMALSDDPEFAWCLAPKCNSGQLNENNGNYMECVGCQYQQCLHHKLPWHTGESCEEYDQRVKFVDASEVATRAMIDGVSKVCPGEGCGWRIQKRDGCDHITCSKCKFQFCYQCRADHREIRRVGNTAHERGCKFHSENLRVSWPFNVHA